MLSIYSVALSKRVPNPSSFIMLEQNSASFIAGAAATSSASIVNYAVNPCSPTLKLTGAFVSPEHSLRSAIQFPPPDRRDVAWHVQHRVLFQSVPKSGHDGVVELMSRRVTVHHHIYGVVAAACPRPRGGTDRESRPVFQTGDALKDFGLSTGVVDYSSVKEVAKREPQIVESSHHH